MESTAFYIAVISSLIALVLLMVKPLWGVMAVIMIRPFVDTTWAVPVLLDLKLTQLVSAAVPLIIFARMIVDDDSHRPFAEMPLKWLWIIWSVDVAVFSTNIMLSQGLMEGLEVLMRHLNGLAGFYMMQAYCRDERDLRRIAWALVITGLFPMMTGAYEGITGQHWRITAGTGGVIRNIGLYHDAITIRFFAQQTIMGLLLVAATFERKSQLINSFLLALGAVAVFVIKGAYSKSGTLSVGLWLLLWPLLRKNTKALGFLAVGTIVASIYYAKEIMDSFGFVFAHEIAAIQGQTGVEHTLEGRWSIWTDMMDEWRSESAIAKMFGAGHIADGAHNDYLQILFHGGIFGLCIYCTLLLAVGWKISVMLVRRIDSIYSTVALLAFIMWMIDTVGLVPSAYSGYQWFVWGLIGLCLRRRSEYIVEENQADKIALHNSRFDNLMGATQ